MKISEYASYDAVNLAELVRKRQISPPELTEVAIAAIEAVNPRLNAVIHKTFDYARKAAASDLPDGPFRGVPYMLKELATMWAGMPTTNSCPYLKDFVAPVDLEIVSRIKRAGFVLVGKTNAPEFGWSITTEPKMYGATKNPWKDGITAGGSSGGSSVAVASRMVPLAEASDGAGSIRVPASNNGIVGLKPSRGTSTFAPIWADYWHGGAQFLCVSRTVRDTAAYLDAVYGTLPGDSYAAPPRAPGYFLKQTRTKAGRLRIGFTTTAPDGNPVHPEAVTAVRKAARLLEDLGHDVEEHDLAFDATQTWITYTRMTAVVTAANFETLAGFIGHAVRRDEVSPVLWSMIDYGKSIGGPTHANDIEALKMASRQIASGIAAYDAYLTPTLTQPPRPMGYYDMNMTDHLAYNAKWTDAVFMFPFNVSGQPAISLPMHWSADGVPMGVQLVARNNDEATLIRVAAQLEEAAPWIDRKPPVSN